MACLTAGNVKAAYDDNGDGIVDVDLNAIGANPECKDLFLETGRVARGPA